MTVQVFKLVDGAEVLANLVSENSTYITISKPRAIQMQSEKQAILLPYLLSDEMDKDVKINQTAIICRYDVTPDLEKFYQKSTSVIQLLG